MGGEVVLLAVLALIVSTVLTGVTRWLALAHGVLDIPNQRSAHIVPTPRGGGLATVVATTVALGGLALLGMLQSDLLVALGGGGGAVALIGFLDDRHSISVKVRLAVHFAAAVWALIWLDGLPPLQVGDEIVSLGWIGHVLGALGIVWVLNLFNFMDGIDGIAASEAVFIAAGGAAAMLLTGSVDSIPAVAIVFAAACLGFLLWNWPPAKIFMGDVGSGYLGYVIAVLAVAAAREHPAAIFVWLILGSIFFIDATVTLVRRLIRGKRAYEPHCSHAYQILARRWGSHRSVTLTVLLVNLLVLWPVAWWAIRHPSWAGLIAVAVLTGLGIAVVATGAGKGDYAPPRQL